MHAMCNWWKRRPSFSRKNPVVAYVLVCGVVKLVLLIPRTNDPTYVYNKMIWEGSGERGGRDILEYSNCLKNIVIPTSDNTSGRHHTAFLFLTSLEFASAFVPKPASMMNPYRLPFVCSPLRLLQYKLG